MGQYKQLNIKNQTYYFFDDMIDIRNFQSNLLKMDKKPYKDIDICYISYIIMKKFNDCEHIYSVNTLYLIINSATGYFKGKNGEKCLIISMSEKYEEVFSEILSEIKTINGRKELFYEKNMPKLGLILTMIYL